MKKEKKKYNKVCACAVDDSFGCDLVSFLHKIFFLAKRKKEKGINGKGKKKIGKRQD